MNEDKFVDFLIDHNIFDAYMYNLEGKLPAENFVCAFVWAATEEDLAFWSSINQCFLKECKK